MVYLHDQTKLFSDVIVETANRSSLPEAVVEKDYYVTMLLQELAQRLPFLVFKGGTSLSKCYKVIQRFSEDIDLAVDEVLTQSGHRKLKDGIRAAVEALGLSIDNWAEIRSRRQFNRYVISYPTVGYPSSLTSHIIIETPLMTLAAPVNIMPIESLLSGVLADEAPQLLSKFALQTFSMKVQSMERTFVDKVFAVCDYYLCEQTDRHSRHLYDIAKMLPLIKCDDGFRKLIGEVRKIRLSMKYCPSAAVDRDISYILYEIIRKSAYKADYDNVTRNLLGEAFPYAKAVAALQEVADSGMF